MKKTMLIIVVIGIILGFLMGLYLHKKKSTDNENVLKTNDIIAQGNSKDKLVNTDECKITPNTIIIKKIYYKDCKHLITTTQKANENLVNLNETEFKEKNLNWEIQKFTKNEVVLYTENEGFCNEHYLLKDENGELIVYQLGNDEKIIDSHKTEISTKFLTEVDKNNLKEGIKVYTKKELNRVLEDFE